MYDNLALLDGATLSNIISWRFLVSMSLVLVRRCICLSFWVGLQRVRSKQTHMHSHSTFNQRISTACALLQSGRTCMHMHDRSGCNVALFVYKLRGKTANACTWASVHAQCLAASISMIGLLTRVVYYTMMYSIYSSLFHYVHCYKRTDGAS